MWCWNNKIADWMIIASTVWITMKPTLSWFTHGIRTFQLILLNLITQDKLLINSRVKYHRELKFVSVSLFLKSFKFKFVKSLVYFHIAFTPSNSFFFLNSNIYFVKSVKLKLRITHFPTSLFYHRLINGKSIYIKFVKSISITISN